MAGESSAKWIAPTRGAKTLPVEDILTGRGFITGKSGSGKSILEGTPVHTESGRKPIEDVAEGEKVLSLNKRSYEQEFRPVQATIKHEADDLLEITLEDGTELVGTEDHSFLTVDDLEIVPVRGSDVREGTWMPLSRNLPAAETTTEIDLAEYVTPTNNVIVRDDEIQSGPKIGERHLELDAAAGRVLGLYLAEGSFDSALTLQISATDENVRKFLGDQGFKVYERTCNRAFKPFAEFVEAEFGRGAADKRVPNWAFDAPEAFRAGLLSGYFDGDGTVDSQVSAMSKAPELLDGIGELLRQFGISSAVGDKLVTYDDERRTYGRLTVDAFSTPRFAYVVDLLIADKRERLAGLVESLDEGDSYNSKDMVPNFGDVLNVAASDGGWNERSGGSRAEAAALHLHTRKQKVGRETFNRAMEELSVEGRAKWFGRSDIQWKRVVSVEELDEERTVYDLNVELNDNFVAAGVFVHNSNTANVVAENLLDNSYNLGIVDPEGEYYGLKEQYEVLHVGAGELCDVQVGPDHGEKLAEITLDQNAPIIIDVSDYLEAEEAHGLIANFVEALFRKENAYKQPYLLMIEEMQEYLPQDGGSDDLAKLLERVAKRGRKRGLGMLGMSQRPAAVDKEFITQCDWMVWHRLTWENDLDVVRKILGSEKADDITDFDPGGAYLMTDWDDSVEQVTFKRKKTHDAGATPGLDDYDPPDLKAVDRGLIDQIAGSESGLDGDGGPGSGADGDVELSSEDEMALDRAVDDLELLGEAGDGGGTLDGRAAGELDREELVEYVAQLERRNEILADEVTELRTILQEAEPAADGGGDGPGTAAGDAVTATAAGDGGAPAPHATGNGSETAGTPRPSPSRPQAPPRPPNRSGVAGTIVEFVEMLGYFRRVLQYKIRLALYSEGDGGRPE
jgi:intein/homing endonuclease